MPSKAELLYRAVEAALNKPSHTAPTRTIERPEGLTVHRDVWLPLEVDDLPASAIGPASEAAERVESSSFGGGDPHDETVERRVRFSVECRVQGTHEDLDPFTTWARAAVQLDPDVAALVRDVRELGAEYAGGYKEHRLAAAAIVFEAVLETLAVDDTVTP